MSEPIHGHCLGEQLLNMVIDCTARVTLDLVCVELPRSAPTTVTPKAFSALLHCLLSYTTNQAGSLNVLTPIKARLSTPQSPGVFNEQSWSFAEDKYLISNSELLDQATLMSHRGQTRLSTRLSFRPSPRD